MSAVNLLLVEGLKDLGAQVSCIRADVDAQLSLQSKSSRSKRGRTKGRQQPWENVQSRLHGIDNTIRRLESLVASNSQDTSGHMQDNESSYQANLTDSRQESESGESTSAKTGKSLETKESRNAEVGEPQLKSTSCRPTSRSSENDDATAPLYDLNKRLISKLAYMDRCRAPQKMTVPKFDVDFAEIQSHVRIDNDWQYTSIRYKAGPKGKGYAMAYISNDKPKPELDLPVLTAAVKRPSAAKAEEVFEDTINNPPVGNIPYFTGHAKLIPISQLDPGERITGDPTLTDLHCQYNHIGAHLSANRIHCEDMTYSVGRKHYGFRSFNEVYAGTGFKLWLLIKPHHITKFNDFFAKTFKCGTCNQRVGHKSVLIAPSRLKNEGIEYTIEVIGRGEAFRTLPGQPHQVINFGACAARSINYLHDDDIFEPKNVDYCCECGIAGATLVPPPPQVLQKPTPAKRSRSDDRLEVVKQLDKDLAIARAVDSLCDIPYIDKSDPCPLQVDVLLMAASVRSKVALDQLCTLTQGLLQQQRPRASDSIARGDNDGDIIDNQIRLLQKTFRDSVYACYLVRHAQVSLAREVDKKKMGSGFDRAKTEDLQRRAKRLGMDNINYHLQEGRNWIAICGPHRELQPLVLLGSKVLGNKAIGSSGFGVTNKGWHALREERLSAFHELFRDPFARRLFAAGGLFLRLMDETEEPTSAWEQVLQDARGAHDLDAGLASYMMLTK